MIIVFSYIVAGLFTLITLLLLIKFYLRREKINVCEEVKIIIKHKFWWTKTLNPFDKPLYGSTQRVDDSYLNSNFKFYYYNYLSIELNK